MSAVAKMRRAGFAMAISEQGGLLIDPASKLTAEQRAFIKQNKVVLLAELRQEPMQDVKPLPTAGAVCCGDCEHSVLPPQTDSVYGWRRCSLGVKDGGGFARQDRRCGQFEHGQIQPVKIDLLATPD